MQTRLSSLIESCANIGLGYGVAILSQLAIFPLFEIHVPLRTNLWIGAWFTGISLVRSYGIRRWFNLFPFDLWRVVTIEPDEGEVIELPACRWVAEAQAEADQRNGKGSSEQGVLQL